jgi:hypothetical protein
MSYEHLLPPEKPRGYQEPKPTDLDCYPKLDGRALKRAANNPMALLGITSITIGIATFPFGIVNILQGMFFVAVSHELRND